MRALLVDTDLRAAHAISLMLRGGGIVTDHTCSGRAALELTQRNDYDVILLDLALADGEGCRTLRLMHDACATPVLALSATEQTCARTEAMASGATDYMAKPFERTELMAHLMAVLRRAPTCRAAGHA